MWPIAKFDLSHTNFTEILLDVEEYLYDAEECTKLSTHLSHTRNYCYYSVSIECCVIQAWLGLTTNLLSFIAQTQRVYPSSVRIQISIQTPCQSSRIVRIFQSQLDFITYDTVKEAQVLSRRNTLPSVMCGNTFHNVMLYINQ